MFFSYDSVVKLTKLLTIKLGKITPPAYGVVTQTYHYNAINEEQKRMSFNQTKYLAVLNVCIQSALRPQHADQCKITGFIKGDDVTTRCGRSI